MQLHFKQLGQGEPLVRGKRRGEVHPRQTNRERDRIRWGTGEILDVEQVAVFAHGVICLVERAAIGIEEAWIVDERMEIHHQTVIEQQGTHGTGLDVRGGGRVR